jgi:hypothetical protein
MTRKQSKIDLIKQLTWDDLEENLRKTKFIEILSRLEDRRIIDDA